MRIKAKLIGQVVREPNSDNWTTTNETEIEIVSFFDRGGAFDVYMTMAVIIKYGRIDVAHVSELTIEPNQ